MLPGDDAMYEFADESDIQKASRERANKGQPVRVEQKVGRNDPCPCGSGKKYKKCCGAVA